MSRIVSKVHVPYLDQLTALLDDIVYEHAGSEAAGNVKRIRQLAAERRSGMPGAEQRLVSALNELDAELVEDVVRAFTVYFDLANLAEELARIRAVRRRSAAEDDAKRLRETIDEAVGNLKRQGMSASEVQRLIDHLQIEPVFTAHPSEAKRRTTRAVLRQLRDNLERTPADATKELSPNVRKAIRADMTALWQSNLLRPTRPDVMNEIERGLFFAHTLWSVVPQIASRLREALAKHFPHDHFDVRSPLQFGTWIGGDRDGHPFVTTAVTEVALGMMRDTAIDGYLEQCRELMQTLVMSDRHTHGLAPLAEAVREAVNAEPDLSAMVSLFSKTEVPRQWLRIIEYRLLKTKEGGPKAGYACSAELEHDVTLLVTTLNSGSQDVVDMYLQPWLDTVQAFGLNFASMDIRQHSRVHESVVSQLMASNGISEDYSKLDSAARSELLIKTLDSDIRLDDDSHPEDIVEALALFRLLATKSDSQGIDTFGGYVVSMTHSSSDVLAVLWLWTHVWRQTCKSDDLPLLPIAPLFETIDDLENAPDIMERLWSLPEYRRYLRKNSEESQLVMIGYSDSTKDGGYLSASWKLHQAQTRLAAIAKQHGIRIVVFHGRGGALGRGGGPAARTVLSLPPAAVNGAMRVTEQGEILAERYDNPEIARRHLEQVTWATLLVSCDKSPDVSEAYETAMADMAASSLQRYRELVTHEHFLSYFDSATPISEIETLPIGSRPSRRSNERSLSDLRAIPWTFALTQSRHLIPAWYGLGTALQQFVEKADGDWTSLRQMYEDWRFFAAVIDNAELALAKTDMDIARQYSALCLPNVRESVWPLIEEEFRRCRAAILLLKQQDDLLDDTRWLQKSIRNRNPGVDPLNLLQIRLLSESRAENQESPSIPDDQDPHLLRLTINGIAAGLRTTG